MIKQISNRTQPAFALDSNITTLQMLGQMYYWWYAFLRSYWLQDDTKYHHIQALHVFLTSPLNKKHALNIMRCLFSEEGIPVEAQADVLDTLVKGELQNVSPKKLP